MNSTPFFYYWIENNLEFELPKIPTIREETTRTYFSVPHKLFLCPSLSHSCVYSLSRVHTVKMKTQLKSQHVSVLCWRTLCPTMQQSTGGHSWKIRGKVARKQLGFTNFYLYFKADFLSTFHIILSSHYQLFWHLFSWLIFFIKCQKIRKNVHYNSLYINIKHFIILMHV